MPEKSTTSPSDTTLAARYLAAKRALFDRYYAPVLNPEQRDAVFTAQGPLLVLAGAGSGKTTVLVNRVAYLIMYGNAYAATDVPADLTAERVCALEGAADFSPSEIGEILPEFITDPCPPYAVLAITFTNKAAREIRERLAVTFDDPGVTEAIWAGTFHSICVRMLRRYGERIGFSSFSIYDTDDKRRMLERCMKELGIDDNRLSVKVVASKISAAKDRLVPPEHFRAERDPREKDLAAIYALYQQRMQENGALDFDDIIMQTVRLLEENPDVLTYYQKKFRQILVDEYQDTNVAQFRLTELLAGYYRNIMVVGDDDQSIYRFRGATVENILNFDQVYPDAHVVKLEQNYRSTETILDAANAVIRHNADRHEKALWSDKGRGEKITLREATDQNDEGRYIVERVMADVRSGKRRYSDFAVLYRVNDLSRSLETTFAKSAVPCRVLGGLRFYERKEIKDMLAYLSLVSRSGDNLRLKRVINEPKRKIGAATVEAVETLARQKGTSMYEILAHAQDYLSLAKSAEKLKAFVDLIESVARDDTLPSAILAALFDRSGYRAMLLDEGFEGEGKIDNVNELIAGALEYEKQCAEHGTEPTLEGYLEEIALVSDVDQYDKDADAVVMMTVHSAKGLEFPVVFLCGMEDGIFPSAQNLSDEREMQEERRLAYVAITRAKEKLYILYAKNRMMYGKTTYNILSCFVRNEIPPQLLEQDRPRQAPPRAGYSAGYSGTLSYARRPQVSEEFRRAPELFAKQPKSASKFGVEHIAVGARVAHPTFGEGEILSSRDLGGDILYEVRFDRDGSVKKLMATFAHLEKI